MPVVDRWTERSAVKYTRFFADDATNRHVLDSCRVDVKRFVVDVQNQGVLVGVLAKRAGDCGLGSMPKRPRRPVPTLIADEPAVDDSVDATFCRQQIAKQWYVAGDVVVLCNHRLARVAFVARGCFVVAMMNRTRGSADAASDVVSSKSTKSAATGTWCTQSF